MGTPQEHARNSLIFHLSGLDCDFPLEAVREMVPMAIPIVGLDRFFDRVEQHPPACRKTIRN